MPTVDKESREKRDDRPTSDGRSVGVMGVIGDEVLPSSTLERSFKSADGVTDGSTRPRIHASSGDPAMLLRVLVPDQRHRAFPPTQRLYTGVLCKPCASTSQERPFVWPWRAPAARTSPASRRCACQERLKVCSANAGFRFGACSSCWRRSQRDGTRVPHRVAERRLRHLDAQVAEEQLVCLDLVAKG